MVAFVIERRRRIKLALDSLLGRRISGILYTLMVGQVPEASRKFGFSVTDSRLIFLMDDLSDQGRDIMRQLGSQGEAFTQPSRAS
jgi:hypothetical protein